MIAAILVAFVAQLLQMQLVFQIDSVVDLFLLLQLVASAGVEEHRLRPCRVAYRVDVRGCIRCSQTNLTIFQIWLVLGFQLSFDFVF